MLRMFLHLWLKIGLVGETIRVLYTLSTVFSPGKTSIIPSMADLSIIKIRGKKVFKYPLGN